VSVSQTPLFEPPGDNPFRKVRVRDSLIWAVGAALIGTIMIGLLFVWTGGESGDVPLAPVFMWLLYGGLIVWIYLQDSRAGTDRKRVVGTIPSDIPFGKLVLLSLALLAVSYAFIMIVGVGLLFLEIEPPWAGTGSDLDFENQSLLFQLVMLLVMAPVLEEIVFRGYFLHRFAAKWNTRTAIWVSSILFALLHFDIVGSLVFGLVASCLYLRTRSLALPMIMHAMHNSVPAFFMVAGAALRQLSPGLNDQLGSDPTPSFEPAALIGMALCLGTILAILLIPSVPFLVHFIRDNWAEPDRALPYFADPDAADTELFWRRSPRR